MLKEDSEATVVIGILSKSQAIADKSSANLDMSKLIIKSERERL